MPHSEDFDQCDQIDTDPAISMSDQDDRSLGNEEDEEQKLFEFVDVPSSGSRRGLLKRIYLLKNVFSKKESSISKGSIYTYLHPVNLDCNLRLEQDQMMTKLLFLRMNCLNHLRKLAKAIQCAEMNARPSSYTLL